jgi:acyl-coenzyme A synthetase/AMP-(fatty) acid ligase
LRQLERNFPGLYALVDASPADCPLQVVELTPAPAAVAAAPRPAFDPDVVAAVAFTSGSTGQPSAHSKNWGTLVRGAKREAHALGLNGARAITLVGTVPAQHMYGLESTVLLALQNGLALHGQRPFYPADIRRTLEAVPGERVLITTPVHLRALLAEDGWLPTLRLIVCATAPLAPTMAAEAERRFACPLLEVYGFTEAGQVATRRTTCGPQWQALPEVRLRVDERGVWFGGGHLPSEVLASDVIEAYDAQRFVLHGRSADMVNVAGKRASLAALNRELATIPGVKDGVFFVPEDEQERVTRLIAFVVASGANAKSVLEALRVRIDPAFLPRPLYVVSSLPRNATGKLTREALARLARTCVAEAERR